MRAVLSLRDKAIILPNQMNGQGRALEILTYCGPEIVCVQRQGLVRQDGMAPLLQFTTDIIAILPKVESRFGEVNRHPRGSNGLRVRTPFTTPQFLQELMDVVS